MQFAFRPFFLLASLWAVVAMAVWVAELAGLAVLPAGVAPLAWHRHEMIFGFVAAAVAGFILTAIPNWTGNLPVSGWRLAVLVAAWGLGRAAMLSGAALGAAAVAIADLAFLVGLCAVVGRELAAGRSLHNLPPVLMIGGLAVGNLLTHLEPMAIAPTAALGTRLAIMMVVLLLALIGGRIVPSFTRNWLAKQGPADEPTALPAPFGGLDRLALASLAAFVVAALIAPDGTATGILGLLAGIANTVRLVRWRGYRVLGEPLLWVLHLGYAWLAVGVVLYGAAALVAGVGHSVAVHALTTGAFATMILGVASRASLGHTGRPLVAGPGTVACYVAVTIAAAARIAAPFLGAAYDGALLVAAAAWMVAFGLFALLYFPVFTGPRVDRT